LNKYLKCFDKYKSVLAINPDESVKALDPENDDEKPELHELTR
jgi:hypothetical protein